jgi:hypothetical protein
MSVKKFYSADGRLFPVIFQTSVLHRFMGTEKLSDFLDRYNASKFKGGHPRKAKPAYSVTEDDVSMWREWVAGKYIGDVAKENGLTPARLIYRFMLVGKEMGKVTA